MKMSDVEIVIHKAIIAGRLAAERMPKDPYKATEARLSALPDIRAKLDDDRGEREGMETDAKNGKWNVMRFLKSGSRLTPEEVRKALLMDLSAAIAADEHEIEVMEGALAVISDDPYYETVTGRYFDSMTDEAIAERISCDSSTVWRNRKRLVQRLAVRLYGAEAVR